MISKEFLNFINVQKLNILPVSSSESSKRDRIICPKRYVAIVTVKRCGRLINFRFPLIGYVGDRDNTIARQITVDIA